MQGTRILTGFILFNNARQYSIIRIAKRSAKKGGDAMKFTIQITETLQKLVEVEACSAEAAEDEMRRRYRLGVVVLDSADHIDTEMILLDP